MNRKNIHVIAEVVTLTQYFFKYHATVNVLDLFNRCHSNSFLTWIDICLRTAMFTDVFKNLKNICT